MRLLITGSSGFIGYSLVRRLHKLGKEGFGVEVDNLPERGHFDYFFHFGSPSSQILFNEDDSCIKDTVEDFIKVVEYCKKKHIKLIFPSSATIYDNNNSYAHTKSALEEIVKAYNIPYLALRIFAGYGQGEEHKKDYASVVYQWVKMMKRGESPTIYGDGEQSRDFVYIDDIVENIVGNLETIGFLDIGTGRNTTFNRLVEIINKELNTKIKPIYIGKPKNYIKETICERPLRKFITIEEGVKKLCH